MHLTRQRTPRRRHRLRIELLETRTLFHAGAFALANGVLDIAPDHGNNTIRVQLDPASRSIGVFLNGQEQLRVASAEVRGLALRGLQGNDIAYMDARLNLPISYDRGGALGVLRGQLAGYDDADYYVATPGCQSFVFICATGKHTKPTEDTIRPAEADATVVRAVAGPHAGHLMMPSAGLNGDGAFLVLGDMGTGEMNHALLGWPAGMHGGGSAFSDFMVNGVKPKIWMPPG